MMKMVRMAIAVAALANSIPLAAPATYQP